MALSRLHAQGSSREHQPAQGHLLTSHPLITTSLAMAATSSSTWRTVLVASWCVGAGSPLPLFLHASVVCFMSAIVRLSSTWPP